MFAPNHPYQPFWIWPVVFASIGAIVGLFWLLHRIVEPFFPSANRQRYTEAMGNALMRVDAVLQPNCEDMVEVRQYRELESAEADEPPETGGRHYTNPCS